MEMTETIVLSSSIPLQRDVTRDEEPKRASRACGGSDPAPQRVDQPRVAIFQVSRFDSLGLTVTQVQPNRRRRKCQIPFLHL